VASPCIKLCEMIPSAGVCAGCFRTLDEIAAWTGLDTAGKRAVLAALPARRAAHCAIARTSCTDADAKR
jgi:predicted Fe-S protein YdhL (DUF1289 family)